MNPPRRPTILAKRPDPTNPRRVADTSRIRLGRHFRVLLVSALAGAALPGFEDGVSAGGVLDLDDAVLVFRGVEPAARAGSAVAGAANLEAPGSGTGGVVVGSHLADPGGMSAAGQVHVILSSPTSGDVALEPLGREVSGAALGDRHGFAVAVGDVDGDGRPDVAMGARSADPGGRVDAGIVTLHLGASAWSDSSGVDAADVRVEGIEAVDHLGWAICLDGDLDGDGTDDLVIGAPLAQGETVSSGEVYVFFGGPHLVPGTVLDPALADVRIQGDEIDGGLGQAVSLGDLDGDGVDDLAIGAPGKDALGRFNAGAVVVLRGSTGLIPGTVLGVGDLDHLIAGAFDSNGFGTSVDVVGDVDGDGTGDLAVGAPYANASGSLRGRAYLFAGDAITGTTLDARDDAAASYTGEGANHLAGFAVIGIGDLDADGFADVAIGAPGASPFGRTGAGAVYVLLGADGTFGGSGSLGSVADRVYAGPDPGAEAGSALAAGRSLTQPAAHDLLIGAPGVSDDAGAVFVVAAEDILAVTDVSVANAGVGAPRPHPFRARVTVPLRIATGPVSATVLDVAGRRVTAWRFGNPPRALVWDGRDGVGRAVTPGVYFLDVSAPGLRSVRKLILAR